jgi:predicted Fe-S protein YdhL (DUF1289 family)
MRSLREIFAGLSKSSFRSRVRLQQKDLDYLRRKGMDVVLEHAADFIEKRLAAARPVNDGKQTPWRGHPVFVAQHATATCCRGCLEKWHAIEKGRALSDEEKQHVIEAIRTWLSRYETAPAGDAAQPLEGRPAGAP